MMKLADHLGKLSFWARRKDIELLSLPMSNNNSSINNSFSLKNFVDLTYRLIGWTDDENSGSPENMESDNNFSNVTPQETFAEKFIIKNNENEKLNITAIKQFFLEDRINLLEHLFTLHHYPQKYVPIILHELMEIILETKQFDKLADMYYNDAIIGSNRHKILFHLMHSKILENVWREILMKKHPNSPLEKNFGIGKTIDMDYKNSSFIDSKIHRFLPTKKSAFEIILGKFFLEKVNDISNLARDIGAALISIKLNNYENVIRLVNRSKRYIDHLVCSFCNHEKLKPTLNEICNKIIDIDQSKFLTPEQKNEKLRLYEKPLEVFYLELLPPIKEIYEKGKFFGDYRCNEYFMFKHEIKNFYLAALNNQLLSEDYIDNLIANGMKCISKNGSIGFMLQSVLFLEFALYYDSIYENLTKNKIPSEYENLNILRIYQFLREKRNKYVNQALQLFDLSEMTEKYCYEHTYFALHGSIDLATECKCLNYQSVLAKNHEDLRMNVFYKLLIKYGFEEQEIYLTKENAVKIFKDVFKTNSSAESDRLYHCGTRCGRQ